VRAVVQRVKSASVTVDGETVGEVGKGLLVLLGVGKGDTEKDADYMLGKISGLRIFEDGDGKFNLSLTDVGGGLLVVSQFTLHGDARKGRRPSFVNAESGPEAERLYRYFIESARGMGIQTGEGRFGAMMDVSLINDGPVTILLDSEKLF